MRIAHISDLHMRWNLEGTSEHPQRRSREVPGILKTTVEALQALKPDLLAVTGDLLDHPGDGEPFPKGFPADAAYDLWLLRLIQARKDMELIHDLLDQVPCRKMVFCGNHDDPAQAIMGVFAKQRHQYILGGYRVISFREDAEDALHVPHRTGKVWERFEQALSDDDPRPQVHLQHYLVWPRRDEGYPHTYAEADEMTRRIAESKRVRLVLSGHYHAGIEPVSLGNTVYAAVPAFCERPHPLWIYDIKPDRIAWEAYNLVPKR
jgi:3',5'-cyclic AMP phosphodiesterase CpdA